MTPQQYEAQIRELKEKLEIEREKKLWWKDQLCGPANAYLDQALGLTKDMQAVVLALYSRPGLLLSKEALLTAIVGLAEDGPNLKIIDVYICRARPKLREIGVIIETVWARGYVMPVRSARFLKPFVMGVDHHGR